MHGVTKLLGAFPYESINFSVYAGELRNLHVNTIEVPQEFVGELKRHLDQLAVELNPRWMPDNKTSFLFVGDQGEYWLVTFWDWTARFLKWSRWWDYDLPANIWRPKDKELVLAAIRPYHHEWLRTQRLLRDTMLRRTLPR